MRCDQPEEESFQRLWLSQKSRQSQSAINVHGGCMDEGGLQTFLKPPFFSLTPGRVGLMLKDKGDGKAKNQ
jgi:hypothetical protein